jgi:hypothetical protein
MPELKSLCGNAEEERFLAPLGMTVLRELAKAVLDENVVATKTLAGCGKSPARAVSAAQALLSLLNWRHLLRHTAKSGCATDFFSSLLKLRPPKDFHHGGQASPQSTRGGLPRLGMTGPKVIID